MENLNNHSNREYIKRIIRTMLHDGTLTFGWKNNITEFTIREVRDNPNQTTEQCAIVIDYVELNADTIFRANRSKDVIFDTNILHKMLRDMKLSDICK